MLGVKPSDRMRRECRLGQGLLSAL